MITEKEPMVEGAVAAKMHRINQEITFHTRRMIEFPSIDGNRQRIGEIERLKSELHGLKWKLGEFERGAE